MLSKYGLPLLAAGLLAFAVTHVLAMQRTPPKLDPIVPPARSPFSSTVAGAGLVEAKSENIYIGAAVPGVVQEVNVTVGTKISVLRAVYALIAFGLLRSLINVRLNVTGSTE